MKKTISILLLSLIITSCSKSDSENSSSANNKSFHPPAWIQGTWVQFYGNISSGSGYKFTSDNVCQVISGGQTCYKELLNTYDNSNIEVNVNESINTNNEYKFSWTIQASTVKLHFKKGTDNKTIFQVYEGVGDIPLTKQ